MILFDTSVWIQHIRSDLPRAVQLLQNREVLAHPFVTGELVMGNLRNRSVFLRSLSDLPQATKATDQEVLAFVEQNSLSGLGIGYLDAHLLASARLSGATLWSIDRRLVEAAERLNLGA